MGTTKWDRVVAGASWVIVAVLLYGVWFILTSDLNPDGPFVKAFGVVGTRVIFSVLYASQALLLAYAKWKKKNVMRRHVLLFIYLTGFFLGLLGLALNGFTVRLVSNFILSSCAAVCWLYWKFRTDYYSVEDGVNFMRLHDESDS